jgi:hypothetical protein
MYFQRMFTNYDSPRNRTRTRLRRRDRRVADDRDLQRALHEATGHVYDDLARAQTRADEPDERLPETLFEELEQLYVATAEHEATRVRISYELVERE